MQVAFSVAPLTLVEVFLQGTLAPPRAEIVHVGVPVGVPDPGAAAVIVAVNFTGWSIVSGLADDVSATWTASLSIT